MEYIIGLDIGTSGAKALAFSIKGKLLKSRKKGYQVISTGDGRMEHDARIVYRETLQCLRALIRDMGHPPLAIGIDAFMHSIMPADSNLEPMGNLMLWNDFRSASVARQLKGTAVGNEIYRHTGTPVHPMSWLTKIRWLADHETDTFRRASYFIGIKEYILYQLTGSLVVDYSMASSTGLFNGRDKKWHDKALEYCGVQPDRLPEPADPGVLLKSNTDDLPTDTAIVSGLSDGCAANLGAASISASDMTLTLGTSGAVRYTAKEMKADNEGVLFSYCLDENLFVIGGASNNCYNVIEKTGQELDMDLWNIRKDLLGSVRASETGLFYLPWMFGERAPWQLYKPLSEFVGLTGSHTADQLLKGTIEGILFNLKHISEKLQHLNEERFVRMHMSGGFADFPGVKELTASIMGLPVVIHQSHECSAIGTAYFTAKQLGIVRDYEEIESWNPIIEEYHPDAGEVRSYANAYRMFVSLAENKILQDPAGTDRQA